MIQIDVDMPESCMTCEWRKFNTCMFSKEVFIPHANRNGEGRHEDCPLQELPSVTPDAVSMEVIDAIRAEIKNESLLSETALRSMGLDKALAIIDKHIGKGKE